MTVLSLHCHFSVGNYFNSYVMHCHLFLMRRKLEYVTTDVNEVFVSIKTGAVYSIYKYILKFTQK